MLFPLRSEQHPGKHLGASCIVRPSLYAFICSVQHIAGKVKARTTSFTISQYQALQAWYVDLVAVGAGPQQSRISIAVADRVVLPLAQQKHAQPCLCAVQTPAWSLIVPTPCNFEMLRPQMSRSFSLWWAVGCHTAKGFRHDHSMHAPARRKAWRSSRSVEQILAITSCGQWVCHRRCANVTTPCSAVRCPLCSHRA